VRIELHETVVRQTATELAYRELRRDLVAVEILARSRAIQGPYATGRLAVSINVDGPRIAGWAVTGRVGSDLPYAASHDRGSEAHTIRAKPGRMLRFYWRKVARNVAFGSVNHPGTRASFFLTGPADDVLRAKNYRVVIRGR
jgi:hypothetical protein